MCVCVSMHVYIYIYIFIYIHAYRKTEMLLNMSMPLLLALKLIFARTIQMILILWNAWNPTDHNVNQDFRTDTASSEDPSG